MCLLHNSPSLKRRDRGLMLLQQPQRMTGLSLASITVEHYYTDDDDDDVMVIRTLKMMMMLIILATVRVRRRWSSLRGQL